MFRSFAKTAYYRVLEGSGAAARRLAKLRRDRKIAILNLHSVTPVRNEYWPPLRPELFETLLEFLVQRFEIRGINELDRPAAERPIAVLSFDDGYYDFVEYALPLLRKFNLRANLNIIPECVISGRPIWNVRLYDFLAAADRKLINEIEIPGFAYKLNGEGPREKLEFGLRISRYLKTRARSERGTIWKSIEPHLDAVGSPATRTMNVDHVRQAAEFVDIGAHSYSHESMGYEENEFFESDFAKCRAFFANELSIGLDTYAFPNGSYRSEQVAYLRRNGIENVLLVDEKFAQLGDRVYPRITVYGESGPEVRMKALNY